MMEFIRLNAIGAVLDDRTLLNELPFFEACRKYGVHEADIAQLLTFARDCYELCERKNTDPDRMESDLERYEMVCNEVEYAINDIGQRMKIETNTRDRLKDCAALKQCASTEALTKDLSYSEGVIHGLELAQSALGDLIEGGFGE